MASFFIEIEDVYRDMNMIPLYFSDSVCSWYYIPDNKFHGAIMGPTWGHQDPGGPHVGPMNLAIGDGLLVTEFMCCCLRYKVCYMSIYALWLFYTLTLLGMCRQISYDIFKYLFINENTPILFQVITWLAQKIKLYNNICTSYKLCCILVLQPTLNVFDGLKYTAWIHKLSLLWT